MLAWYGLGNQDADQNPLCPQMNPGVVRLWYERVPTQVQGACSTMHFGGLDVVACVPRVLQSPSEPTKGTTSSLRDVKQHVVQETLP